MNLPARSASEAVPEATFPQPMTLAEEVLQHFLKSGPRRTLATSFRALGILVTDSNSWKDSAGNLETSAWHFSDKSALYLRHARKDKPWALWITFWNERPLRHSKHYHAEDKEL